ncbi:MAG TPA: hydroxymethylbilane synthase [Thermomicrobiales bacterium]
MTVVPTAIRIGARGSALSRRQAEQVARLIGLRYPQATVTIEPIVTKGDRVLETPLPLLGGKGAFTEEIEAALLDGRIELAVHSLKDLPTRMAPGLVIGAVLPRSDPSDVLISRSGRLLRELPEGAVVGTSSLRRSAQLKRERPELETRSIRGNVDTRLRKLHDPDGPYDAILLARAGLERLGLLDSQAEVLPLDVMLPAPGQGALAVQCRDDPAIRDIASSLNDEATALVVTAERAFLSGLGGGCSAPVAAYGWLEGGELRLHGRVVSLDGGKCVDVQLSSAARDVADADQVGRRAADQALAEGAATILEAVK